MSLDASDMYRSDGTPLDFSSREAKQEAQRQKLLERHYEAAQSAWGLPVASSSHGHATTAPPGPDDGTSGAWPPAPESAAAAAAAEAERLRAARIAAAGLNPIPPRGRGRHGIKPMWLARMEQERGSN